MTYDEYHKMMAELFAKKTGYNHGKGGSMHLAATEIGILGANGITAGGMPVAVGAGLSTKLLSNGGLPFPSWATGQPTRARSTSRSTWRQLLSCPWFLPWRTTSLAWEPVFEK